jgi:hypothetical protein
VFVRRLGLLVLRLIFRLIVVFISFILKDQLQSVADSINDLDINVADPEA